MPVIWAANVAADVAYNTPGALNPIIPGYFADPTIKKFGDTYVCFDGRTERVYVNGKLVSEKDLQLLVKPVQFVTLGRNAENEWPFTGYLHSLDFWDEFIPYASN